MDPYDWCTIYSWLVVPQNTCILSPIWLVWTSNMVAQPSLCTCWYVLLRVSLRVMTRFKRVSYLGSVSCGVWQMACERMISMVERVVKEFWIQGAFLVA